MQWKMTGHKSMTNLYMTSDSVQMTVLLIDLKDLAWRALYGELTATLCVTSTGNITVTS